MNNVRGTYDYLPEEQILRNQVIEVLRGTFESYGFNPIETPILCLEEVLASKYAGGAEILKEVYTLKDQGERSLGLRYDLTVPFSRFIGMNKYKLTMPFKKYEIGKVFRNGPIKLGRKREFYQADVDVVGVKSFYAEIEYFQMIDRVANELGFNVVVKYSNRKVLTEILKTLNVPETDMSSIILTIDKIEKLSEKDILCELYAKGMSEAKSKELMNILKLSYLEIYSLISNDELSEMTSFMDALNQLNTSVRVKFVFTPSLARGLEVYTGIIWEVFVDSPDSMITSSIGAGGRYDKIISRILETDEEYPAVGMTFGVDVIMEVLKELSVSMSITKVDYLIIPMKSYEIDALVYANILRELKMNVDVDLTGRKLKKSLNSANVLNIPFISIFGEDEKNSGVIRIKNMEKSIETPFGLSNIKEISNFIREKI